MRAQILVQCRDDVTDLQVLGLIDRAGELVPEGVHHRPPVQLAGRYVVELFFQRGGEAGVDVMLEERNQERGHQPAAILGCHAQALRFLEVLPALAPVVAGQLRRRLVRQPQMSRPQQQLGFGPLFGKLLGEGNRLFGELGGPQDVATRLLKQLAGQTQLVMDQPAAVGKQGPAETDGDQGNHSREEDRDLPQAA